ncbi:His/Gly/Thr/Pro-type tRNA ligase C-terminal domain-containing protein, partial [Hydrogenovibrio marinus]
KNLVADAAEADIFMVLVGEAASRPGFVIAEQLRERLPQVKVVMNCGGGSFKSQFKKADKSGARVALIMAEDEVNNQQIGVKFLREEKEQVTLGWQSLEAEMANYFNEI